MNSESGKPVVLNQLPPYNPDDAPSFAGRKPRQIDSLQAAIATGNVSRTLPYSAIEQILAGKQAVVLLPGEGTDGRANGVRPSNPTMIGELRLAVTDQTMFRELTRHLLLSQTKVNYPNPESVNSPSQVYTELHGADLDNVSDQDRELFSKELDIFLATNMAQGHYADCIVELVKADQLGVNRNVGRLGFTLAQNLLETNPDQTEMAIDRLQREQRIDINAPSQEAWRSLALQATLSATDQIFQMRQEQGANDFAQEILAGDSPAITADPLVNAPTSRIGKAFGKAKSFAERELQKFKGVQTSPGLQECVDRLTQTWQTLQTYQLSNQQLLALQADAGLLMDTYEVITERPGGAPGYLTNSQKLAEQQEQVKQIMAEISTRIQPETEV